MPFREKTAWMAIVAMLVAYGGYFAAIERTGPYEPNDMLLYLGLFAAASVVRIIIEFGGRFILASRSPEDARAPADERDRAIAHSSAGAAYFALMIGMILVGIVMPFSEQGWTIVNAAIFFLVAAELVRCSATVVGYRLGVHA